MQSLANTARKTRNVMRIHRTGIALMLALSFVPACRSASVAHRPTSSIRVASHPVETRRIQTPTGSVSQSAETADDAVVGSESDRLPGNEERVRATIQAPLATVQQVSAEAINDLSDPLLSAVSVNHFSIQSAVETALAQNPDLNSLRQAEGVGSATVGVAQTYPFNPFVQVRSTPYQRNTSGGSGPTFHYVLLMQQIQLGHQQQHREEAACAALNTTTATHCGGQLSDGVARSQTASWLADRDAIGTRRRCHPLDVATCRVVSIGRDSDRSSGCHGGTSRCRYRSS